MSLASAIAAADPELLPSRREEGWRWSDLRGLLKVLPPPAPDAPAPAAPAAVAALGWPMRTYVNGRRLVEGVPDDGRLVRRFVAANPGVSALEDDLEVGSGERLVLLDVFEGYAAGAVTSVTGKLTVRPGASLERVVLLADSAEAVFAGVFEVEVEEGGRFEQTVLAAGALRQRVETRVRAAASTHVRLDGAYVLGDRRHSDQTTELRHHALGGESRQLVKGLVAGQARSVFQGRIVVERGADGTDARMGSHALVLSDRAEVDAKPELEIYADDVQCAHGNTVGALDEDALFYAQSRGLPPEAARRLLAFGFVGEVVERIGCPALQTLARDWAEGELERMP